MNTFIKSVVASTLLTTSVALELIWPAVEDMRWGLALFMVMQVCGWTLVAQILAGIQASGTGSRAARVCLVGCFFQVAFAVLFGVTGLVTGTPFGGVFVLLALGFLILFVGGLMLGRALWSEDRVAAAGAVGVAVPGLLAIALEADPWHDVALLASLASWVVVGWARSRPRVTTPLAA